MEQQVAQVVIPPLHEAYSYLIPEQLAGSAQVGSSVEVPLGSRTTRGFIVSIAEKDAQSGAPAGKRSFTLKPIKALSHSGTCFSAAQLSLFKWVADYYGAPLANVIDVAVPAAVPRKFDRHVRYERAPEAPLRGSVQKQLVAFLQGQSAPVSRQELTKRFKGCAPALKKLEELGVVSMEETEIIDQYRKLLQAPDWAKSSVELNEPQERAVREISDMVERCEFASYLLHGVTGSGKTEVYIEIIQHALAAGKGALVIVPEIALTPQLVDRFAARLGDNIALLHSGLSKRVRWDSWRALLEGRCAVAIGARSGIFAPIENPGVIIVDEEHDSSYKQSEGLRYNARDLAVARGQFADCPVVLGSATPSLESFHNALRKRYHYLSLPGRHQSGSALSIELVDLNRVKPWEMPSSNVSPALHTALEEILGRGEQAFILYNRRGFASYLQCDTCNTVVECPNCSVTLTYHQGTHTAQCHYCGFSAIPSEFCPACMESKDGKVPADRPGTLVQRGAGTEKVYDELQELFPQYRIDRLDRDVATNQEVYEGILNRMRNGETQLLVGTQMIAKGHDLPGVTLVGVIDCDIGLHMPDFRASERVYQLLTQASGRAGRGDIPGRVFLQTRVPTHSSITKTLEKDYAGFARQELRNRKDLKYPPYARMLRILISSEDADAARSILEAMKESLQEIIERESLQVQVLGPTSAPLQRLKTHFRWHLLLKSLSSPDLHRVLNILKTVTVPRNCRFILDRDPQDLL